MIFGVLRINSWNFLANIVFWNNLQWDESGLFEVKETLITVAGNVSKLTIITLDSYNRMKQ